MLGNHYFYWSIIKNNIVAFGSLFDGLYVTRSNHEKIKVPISYGPKEKMLARLERRESHEDGGYGIALTLPRMSFEMTGMTYDSDRASNKRNMYVKPLTTGDIQTDAANHSKFAYATVPYNIDFELSIVVKYESDVAALISKILPMFRPQVNIPIIIGHNKHVEYDASIQDYIECFRSGMEITVDTPIFLNSVTFEDTYEGDFETRRALIWTLSFTMKAEFIGASHTSPIIKKPSTGSLEGTFNFIPYAGDKTWNEITVDDQDNIEWLVEFNPPNV